MRVGARRTRVISFAGRIAAFATGLYCVAALGGCTAMQVKLGMKVYLDRTPVSSMEATLPKGPAIAPGQKSPLVVTLIQPDGKVLLTEGKGGGKVMWRDLHLTSTVVSVNKNGIVSLTRDPRVSDGKIGHVTATAPSHPDLHADLDIPFRYDIDYVANFSGSRGFDGTNGTDGINGTSGAMGSIDPNNPSPGGNGTDGTDGSDGHDGDRGGDAPPVDVRVAFQPGTPPLLQVSVSAAGKQRLSLVDPKGGSVTVRADGGPGGSGGRGGRGGQGGSGGIGTPNGSSGRNGFDGRAGSDGSEGRGGEITVTYDPDVEPFLKIFHLYSLNGPAPKYDRRSVAALW